MVHAHEFRLAKNLRRQLDKRKLCLRQLAEIAGVSASTIHAWLAGRSPHDLVALKRVADYFSLSLEELCFQEERAKLDFLPGGFAQPAEHVLLGVYEVILRKPPRA